MTSTLFRRVLCPHDFSDAADHALREAATLAGEAGGRLHVLYVQQPFYVPINVPTESMPNALELLPDQRAALEKRVRKVLGPAAPPVSVSAEVGQPANVILRAARRADSIVMATQGRTGLPRLMLGSVAERIVRHSPVPVLTIRARKGSRARKGAGRGRKAA
jgi:nucleotide-binding universal stress UspA family protein